MIHTYNFSPIPESSALVPVDGKGKGGREGGIHLQFSNIFVILLELV